MKYLKGNSFKTGVIFTSGNIIVAIIGGISGIFIGKWIDPELLGEFNTFGILTAYLGFGIVFVDAAFQRHFPYYIGKDKLANALEIASVAKWWYLLLVAIGTSVYLALVIIAVLNGNKNATLGWLAQIPVYIATTFGLYLRILYRSNDDFLALNKNSLITASAGFISLPLVYYFNFLGLASRTFLQNTVNTITHMIYAPYKVKAKYDRDVLVKLVKVSLPIQIPVYFDTHLLNATISLTILKTLGEKDLGIFVMAIMLQSFLLVFSRSLNQIMSTKLMLKYGSNDSIKKTFLYVIKPTIILTLIGMAILIVFNVTIQSIVTQFIPKYIQSVPVLKILSVEMVLALIRNPFTIFMSSLMLKEMAIIRIIKVMFTFILLIFMHHSIIQIVYVIISASILNVIFGYLLLFNTMRKESSN
jgi:hypothetical protein